MAILTISKEEHIHMKRSDSKGYLSLILVNTVIETYIHDHVSVSDTEDFLLSGKHEQCLMS